MTEPLHLIDRIFNRPLAITREKAEIILGVLGPRFDVARLVVPGMEAEALTIEQLMSKAVDERERLAARAGGRDGDERFRPYQLHQSVAVVRIRGTLVSENQSFTPYSGKTGYDGIRANLKLAMDDPEVRGLLFDIDSPGGEPIDLFELTDEIAAHRGNKPMRAMVRGMGASAAYAIASAADEVTVTQLGTLGSVGVIWLHADFSKFLADRGVTVTLLRSGKHKAEVNEVEPLPDGRRAEIQAEMDFMYGMFVDRVADRRGLTSDQVRDTEARLYRGDRAVEIGFADKVASWTASVDEFVELVNAGTIISVPASAPTAAAGGGSPTAATESPMTTKAKETPAAAETTDGNEGVTANAEDETVIARAAERERIQAIMADCPAGMEDLRDKAIEAGTSTGDFARQVLTAQKERQASALGSMRAVAATVEAALPEASSSPSGEVTGSDATAADFVLAAMRAAGRDGVVGD